MGAIARRVLRSDRAVAGSVRSNGAAEFARRESGANLKPDGVRILSARPRVFVAANNRLVREVLARLLTRKSDIEVIGMETRMPLRAESVVETDADVLLLMSRGVLNADLLLIQPVHAAAPGMRILLLGIAKNEAEFLRCVRAGISGYLLHDASADEVVEGVRAVHPGEAVCPGTLCTALFRYFESEARAMLCQRAAKAGADAKGAAIGAADREGADQQ